MAVALESARHYAETQRLFKESEQRAAELAIITSVQSALASKLDIQGIYEAVGDRLRETFGGRDVRLAGVLIDIDESTGRARGIDRFLVPDAGA